MKTLDSKKIIYWSVCKVSETPEELLEYTNTDLKGTYEGEACYWLKTDFKPPLPCQVLKNKKEIYNYFNFDIE